MSITSDNPVNKLGIDERPQTSVGISLMQKYILRLVKENPSCHVNSTTKESTYRIMIRLLSQGATERQISITIDWCFSDLYWKSRVSDAHILFYRWNELSSKALASKPEKEAIKPRSAVEPILFCDLAAIEKNDMSKEEAARLSHSAAYMLAYDRTAHSAPLWQAIIALSKGEPHEPFIEVYKANKLTITKGEKNGNV